MKQHKVKPHLTVTQECCNAICARYGIHTGRELAKKLQVTEMTVSRYLTKHAGFDDYVALHAAHLLEIDADVLLARITAERQQHPKAKEAWIAISERLGKLAKTSLAGAVAIIAIFGTAGGDARAVGRLATDHDVYYVN